MSTYWIWNRVAIVLIPLGLVLAALGFSILGYWTWPSRPVPTRLYFRDDTGYDIAEPRLKGPTT